MEYQRQLDAQQQQYEATIKDLHGKLDGVKLDLALVSLAATAVNDELNHVTASLDKCTLQCRELEKELDTSQQECKDHKQKMEWCRDELCNLYIKRDAPRKSIPKKVKNEVWNRYIGEDKKKGLCYACKKTIDVTEFHCAHVIADINGGLTTVDNLRPTCSSCNLSCGRQNLDDFRRYFE